MTTFTAYVSGTIRHLANAGRLPARLDPETGAIEYRHNALQDWTPLDGTEWAESFRQSLTCPRCGRPDSMRWPTVANALSRKDSKTYICPSCGTAEAMRDLDGQDVWPGHPGPVI